MGGGGGGAGGGSSSAAVAAASLSQARRQAGGPGIPALVNAAMNHAMVPILAAARGRSEDVAVDPNEPLYCVCRRVSFGEMVGCDNDDCTFEWFHFNCVGLTAQPTGKWFCPNCERQKAKAKQG